ncbi:non-ribosomal peptide synthase/polyketide synthase [Dyella acidiphila]|uniref:Non-ribosomal peptide synthase/polyketide synthase n=1 Tax=Dyella acidiphila TaxID=2775866 RepID=A0ABR9GDC6_9GAMM|nr:non-ribosomal peptide synthase/polyketide synthase [Dyella acidiphila]MBE1162009.1 non-ribosomal peptide synthase/polyketide synthase [Dyella acidiphila]
MNCQSIPDVLTLFDVIRYRASAASGTANSPAFTYLDDGDQVSGVLSYAELDLAARKLAARLQQITQPGDRVLLVYPPSLDYIVAFYACVYAGVTAVPALPPANRRTLPRLRLMAADSQPAAALTLARIRDGVTKVEEGDPNDDILRQMSWLSTDDAEGDESAWVPPAAQASDIVFLQYTSGSTGAPKGVMVANHNLLANLRLFQQMFDVRCGETFVFWLPPHHDFGLIGAIIMPVFAGAHSVQFPPAAFMMSPVRWLRLISRYRARLTGAPNFAFQLCVDKISDAQMQGLDLACLDVAMNGAERIRFESVAQFADKFAPYGFRRESMMPSYGMAEFVLLATANMHRAAGTLPDVACISKAALEAGRIVPGDRPQDTVHIVSVGRTHEALHDLAVVDPLTLERQGDRQVGEVWLSGPAVTQGYWRQDEAAREQTFRASMKDDERTWLRTGDVGFVSEGELFITGRSKEVMIFSGRNIYPQDVEITVERASPAFRANGCAAFSLEEGDTAQLVIVQEVESRRRLETESLVARLRADIAEQHEIFDLAAVVLVRPGHLPRTSSGKIQRVRCRQMHLAGEFDSIWSWSVDQEDAPAATDTLPQTATGMRLLELWRSVFGNPALSASDNFFRLGGHSLLAAQLVAAVGTEFRVDLPLRALFEAPNVAAMAAVIDTLQPREAIADELLALPQHGDLPLSFVQQRFWFLDQYQPANAFYAVPVAMRLAGELALPALRQALDAMVQRHAALRTVFPVADGVPVQRVLPALAWPLQVSDAGELDADAADAQIRQLMMDEARKPFDLVHGPLIRAHLLKIGAELRVLLLTLHHIVHDGWSVGVLIDELTQAYTACKAAQPPALPALPVSYADYTQWERRRYGEQNIQTHLAYWAEHLRGASPLLALPTDRPRPASMSYRGATHTVHLPAALVRRLAEQASQRNATLFMALTSAVQILLHRYCSQDDICISMLSANRPAKTEQVIGAFVNVVPLRAQFGAGQAFADVLAATTREVLSAYEQQLPFELILNRLARERHAAYTPYAQVVLNFHSELEHQGGARQHGLDQSLQFDGRWAAGVAHTAFDLLLDVHERQGGLDVVFEYSTDLFDAASMRRWGRHLQQVLHGIAESPDARIDEFALLDAGEREQVLETFNATAQRWPAASLVHQLFETTAAQQPDAIALIGEHEQLSYRSLNQRANQLAHVLIAQGIQSDDRIALCVERSIAMVVGLLGILKAGGAYVPVDPDYPPERVSYMLADSQPRMVLSSHALRDRLPVIDVPMLWLDDPAALSSQPDHNPDPQALGLRPDHLAYVIYTSGSTGQPKGAMNQHDGVVNRLRWAQQQFALDASDRVLQKTPYAFDVSVWEFFLPLLAGAQLVLARPGGHQSPAYLAQRIAEAGITVAHFVPSMLQVFLDQDDLSGCSRMRHVLCSGEALPPVLQNRFLQKLPGVALHNLYGPTEAAVDVTYWPCMEPGTIVPIGRPIANTQMYVLDARMQPVPIGVAGELYIGGVQVGRGYLHRAALTEERFVANPFGSGRLYKTGDLGRWRADGAIEYLGRNDFQVKLRGLRIELGEIEARLLEHPAIREAVVIAREETSGDKRLVAYVVQHQQAQHEETDWDDRRVEQWRQLYQAEYGKTLEVSFGEDFRTWNSSYDGQPIPLEQMREWRDATVARILALQPRHVLEIGCGSGLILAHLAPHCESYCGTDLSAEAIARLSAQVERQADIAPRVSLHCQPAHSSGNLPRQHFDVIVINSVAQYFPSADYMLAVVRQAMDLLAPGGALFLGDIRNLPLLPCLTTAIQLARADSGADAAALRSAIERELRLEQELIFDPDFFASLPARIDGMAGVDIRVKRGHFANELSRYRYDVVVHKQALGDASAGAASLAALPRLHWGAEVVDVASLRSHLQTPAFAGLRLCGVPNHHLASETEAVQAFEQGRPLDEVVAMLQRPSDAALPHPEAWHALAAVLELEAIVTWSAPHGKTFQRGEWDVLFVPAGQRAYTDTYAASREPRPLDELSTRPAQRENSNQLLADLRASLSGQLPDYMLPSAFVVLDALPLTPSGKLDRQALPAPDRDAVVTHQYEAPQGEAEQAIAAIWGGLLGVTPVGRHDHFFELGGHSLLATQVAAKLRASLSVDVPLKALFEHATLAALAAHIQDQAGIAPGETELPLVRMPRPSATPASFAQQRLWFIEQLGGGQPVYTVTHAVRLRGALELPALQAALTDLAARQEGLRTYFVETGGTVMQELADAAPLSLRVVDLSGNENGTLQSWIEQEARQGFDLNAPPLLRLTLLREHAAQHVLLISAHHIIADGWSLGVFNRELSALYNAHRQNRPSPLRELPLQYADFAHWQRRRAEQGAFEPQLAYWQQRLHNAPAALPLPTDYPRPAAPSHRGGIVRCVVPKAVTHSLKLLLQQTEASLFMGLAAGLAALLSRYAGQNEICIGTPVANRQHVALDDVIGFFVNTLVLRIDADGSQSVASLLRHARNVALDAYANQEVPFDQVVASLDRARHDLHSPLFQVMLVLQNASADDLALAQVEAEVLPVHNGTAKFDLTVAVTETAGELACDFEYSTDLFEHASIERMARQFVALLRGMTVDVQRPVERLPLLDDAERRQLLVEFSALTSSSLPSEALIHTLFEQQVRRSPDAVALNDEERSLTYAQLNERANRLAHALIARGVKPDDRVALGVERGLALVVGILGILKAGAGYVPLDPTYPAERLAYLLEDSAPVLLLTQASLQACWPKELATLYLDDESSFAAQPTHDPVVVGLAAHNLAYVIYTSGSTGQPKGVMVEHAQVTRLLATTDAAFRFDSRDVWTLFHSYAFDFSVWELWGALAYGGRLVIVPSLCARSPKDFYALLCRERVTVLNQTPSAFRALIAAQDMQPHQLRYVIFGGEALELYTLLPWIARNDPARTRLINMYGITETTVHVTYRELTREDIEARRGSLIGRGLPDLRVYLLDRHGEPVPVGMPGEIYVGGAGVARGYWGRPQLTAERFLCDPFVGGAQSRMYKSGDLGRWLSNGELEYLGRNDFQVKIRGFRIELGEIEAKLARQPGVRDALVIAREDVPGDKRLVAYLTAQDGATLSTAALRDALARELADYMLPSAFMQLEQLPLTANGKLDRYALPAPDQQAVVTRAYEAPHGDTELAIAAIWQDLLCLERVGRHDHFFELGGHSLLAVQVLARIRAELGVELPLRDLFALSTLQALAQATANGTQVQLAAIPPIDRRDELPLSWAQQRLWFIHQLDPAASLAYHMPGRLRLRGQLDVEALQSSFERIVVRHEVLRTRFVSIDGRAAQVIDASSHVPLLLHDLRGHADAAQEAERLALDEARAPFDLSHGPLLRLRLLQLADDDHILLLTQHHIVSDGWSAAVLLREVSALYNAYRDGRPDPLPGLPIQYADYAMWQREDAQRTLLQTQAAYWQAQLDGAPSLLSLPTDRPRPAAQSYRGDQLTWTFAAQAEQALRLLSQQHGTTLFMTALAAWSIVLSHWSGQGEVVIGTPVANRQRQELEPLLGFFVNTLALRIRLDDAPTVGDLLARIKSQLVEAYTHQDLPFEQLVEILQPPRSLSHSPVFQVMLAMNNAPGDALHLPGLHAEVLAPQHTTAHFDVTLSLQETGQHLLGQLSYASDLFERSTIERMARHFAQVVRGMAADARQSIDRLSLLDEAERGQLLAEFSTTKQAPSTPALIHALFEQQAQRQPDAVALTCDDQALTYAQLNERANALAHALIARGVKPDDRVALGVERGLTMVVGVLGILKAGAGYVPLDPTYPAERLAYLLEDSAPVLLLTQASLQACWPAELATLYLDDESSFAGQPVHNPAVEGLDPSRLAYVIYTSGSTGQPKGVMVEHAQVTRLLATTDAAFRFDSRDVWTLFHSYAFDFSVWELWGALAYGGRLVIVPSLCARSPKDFYALLCRERVTVLNQTPSAFRALIAAQDMQPHQLRYVIFGGEALELHTLLPWIARNDPARTRLINMYGITETTVHVTYRELTREDIEAGRGSLIGRGLPDLRVYLLDRHGEPVPVGVPGEIYVGGAGVARGYWNRPQLTAERFRPDPFAEDGSARMYKSGDLGRWLPNGELEYLGRNDFQVKIRGFRIELGEIEAKLARQAHVRDAVVIAREDVPGDKRLVAYLTAQDGATLSTAALRDALAKELADYMLPSAFVQLEQLPLTANGKLDRQALPAPDQQAVVRRAYEAPHGDTELAIAAIWQGLLGLERVGRHDHFFELGGHSLLAVQMMAQLRAACRVELPLRMLFDAPTLAMLAAAATQAQPQAVQADEGMVHEAHDGSLPLSFAQQRFWFLDQYQLDNTFYNVAMMVSLHGALDTGALEQAMQWMVERHAILRTVFASEAGVPQQIIHPSLQLPWRVEDIGDEDGDTHMRAVMAEEAQTPFDVAHGPLLRARLLRRHAHSHVLLLTTHHIVYDGWSIRILLDELSRAYAAFKTGLPVGLPELPVDYADYTRWEQRRYAGSRVEADLRYWQAQLKAAPSLLALPTDRPRQAVMTHRGASLRMHLPESLVQRLTALANERHATLFMAMTAITQAWLHRYCGQQDMSLGVISAARPAGTEGLIGNFINILPLTTHIDETTSFMDLLDIAAENLLAAHDRQVPFELLLQHVLQEHSSAYIPYAQVVLNFHNEIEGMRAAWSTDDVLSWQVHDNDARDISHAAFDLKLEMNRLADGLEMVLEYNTDLFDRATIASWSGHYRTLLESVCSDPRGRIHHLQWLTQAEQQAFADAWRETQAAYPRDTGIGELLDLQASRTPEAVAVVHRDRSLSYRELRQRTDQLAAYLRSKGVGPDTLVGIYTERSLEMVLAVWAVVKAGAAYVPLDPAYPQARIAHMLGDACPAMVLTEARLASRLQGMAAQIISVDALDAVADGSDMAALPPLGSPTDLAYVIYTSGSTGRPKGAMVHRQGFVNLLHWYIRQFGLCADDKVLLLSSFSFDLTQKNIFSVLLVGGQLHLPAGEDALSGAGDYVERHGITYLNCAPSAFYPLLADGGVRRLSSLRQVFLGGEPIRVALIHDAYRGLPRVPLIHNTYGPTEASDVVSFHTWDPHVAVSTLPIGRAIANTRLYVLDPHRQLLPQGAVGELYVGGDGVGRGYLHLAALTEERFLSDPYAQQPGARMYRTGDVVRQVPGGEIEYLGRNDFQVKIRGFRIELGEIEAKLAACAGVREAVVIDREDTPGDKRLVAYLTAHDGQTLSNAALRDSLARELADYMLPSAFVQLEQLPLTPNGKLDRQALPAPDQQSVVTRAYEAPQGEIEQAIASIWQQLLGLERVGRHDHFFELGGHSLLATQLVSRVGAAFEIGLPLRAVFEAPTLAELAACIAQSERRQDTAPIPHIGRDRPLPLSFAQQRLWFLDQFESRRGIYNIPAAVRLRGSLEVAALERTLNEIVRRHESLRTSFVLVGDEPVQVIAPALSLPLEVIDLDETQARALMQEEVSQAFDLATGPLIRFRLIRLAAQEHILLFTVHHIVSDGWSMGVVVREVAALYPAFMQGQPSPLPELPIHYADFAHWQRQWLRGEVLERQRRYWKQRLAGSPGLLPLPTDRPRPSSPSHAGASVPFAVPAVLVSRLHALGSSTQSTLFMVLCAAFNVLLARYADQTDICIGTPIANRHRGDIEELIGFFVNTLVLRTEVDLGGDFHTLLQQVRQHTLDAYAHQDVPFEQLVEVLQPERNTSYTPLFQVMLALHNTPLDELALPGLAMSAVESETVTAKFDLSLSLLESRDGLQGHFEYSTDLFDAGTIERMRDHFARLLQAIVAEPQAPVGDLAMLSEAERQQLLYRFNDSTLALPPDPQALHQLFEAQAARTPEQVALVHAGVAIRYAELNRRANQLAHHLRTLGVGPDRLVGICMTRTPDLIVALLGVLKAGGAYVPLDPAYPAERIVTMLTDAGPAVLLTQQHLRDELPAVPGMQVLCVDAEAALLAAYSGDNPVTIAAGDDLAYVIYTSGSTGKPKGVAIRHRNVTAFVHWALATFDRDSLDKVLASTSICFDLSIFEIFVPLSRGGSVWLVDNILALAERPDALPVTLINTVPSAMAEVHRSVSLPGSIKVINLAGEALSQALVQSLYRQSSVARVYNLYGPSEDTTYSTFTLVPKDSTASVSIGRPIANSQAYILDARQQPVPIGVAGELFMAGAGLARGYLHRPALTAEKFLPNPFSAAADARMYRTGDLARYLPDGQIEYLGRVDFQVKIRGFRIELGEIEVALSRQAGVRDAVVIAREDVPGDKRLVAYLTTSDGQPVSTTALRNALAKDLPEYMLPGAFVQLEQLPLTPNGKLNRQALPAPDRQVLTSRDYEAPQGEIEQTIALVWQEVLGLERVGRQDHFFELGGHSLLAVRVIARLCHACHVDIPLAALFKAPELAAFAQTVLSLQLETFLGEDIEAIQQELDALSEAELLALLEKDAGRD